ncbi:MAG TPA: hypothetical protein VNI34_05505 [Candidatus Nitrosotalea sp.]|nr:hypothetical protein [Candidatus Nitrosotalea sp.]
MGQGVPGNNESAGERFSGGTGVGTPWLPGALVEAAWAASHTHDTYLSMQYHRIAACRGKKRAVVAVGHSILITIYHLLRDGTIYQDLGAIHFDNIAREHVTKGAISRLERLGFKVTVEPAA